MAVMTETEQEILQRDVAVLRDKFDKFEERVAERHIAFEERIAERHVALLTQIEERSSERHITLMGEIQRVGTRLSTEIGTLRAEVSTKATLHGVYQAVFVVVAAFIAVITTTTIVFVNLPALTN